MVICLERGADLHMAQLMPLPLTVSCFSKIQIAFTFLVPAHPGSPGKGPLKGCVCVCVFDLGIVFLVPIQETCWEEHLRNELFCVEWDVNLNSINQSITKTTEMQLTALLLRMVYQPR